MPPDKNSPEYEKADLKRGVDFIGVCCVFCCHDGKGGVLLHKRSQKCRDEQGRWDFGSGAMEFGETFEDAVRREVKEEYGVEPLAIEYVATKNVLRTNNGVPTHWVKNLHVVLVDRAKVRNADPEKIDEVGWFELENLPTPFHSQIAVEVPALKTFLAQRAKD